MINLYSNKIQKLWTREIEYLLIYSSNGRTIIVNIYKYPVK